MDKNMDAQFQRIESALNTLIESISAYNPSPSAALDLVAADDRLSESLDLRTSRPTCITTEADLTSVATHQKNYARILSLRQQYEDLDHQIKADVSVLANTRRELLATPATSFPATVRDVAYGDVLSYARRISKFTVPPTFRQAPPNEVAEDRKTLQTNRGQGSPPTPPANDTEETPAKEGDEGIALASLPAEHKQWLDPTTGMPFVPWPSDDVMRRGGLAQIQSMVEHGVDLASASAQAQQEAEGKVRADEDKRVNAAREEEDRIRRQSMAVTGRTVTREVEGPKVFGGLDLFDPEAEDEEG